MEIFDNYDEEWAVIEQSKISGPIRRQRNFGSFPLLEQHMA